MRDRLPPLNALRAFESVARHLRVKKAAAELHVTSAAISHQIKQLEDLLGHELFVRKARRIELTDAARAALPRLSTSFDQMVDAVRELRERGATSTLTVSVAPSFATCWLMPRLHRFLTEQPDVDFRVTVRTRQSTAVAGQARRELEAWLADADVAVLLSTGNFPGLAVERLVPLTVTPLASPRLVGHEKLSAVDLRRHALIHDNTGRMYDGHDFWELWLNAAGFTRMKFARGPHLSHSVFALEAAAEGVGIVATSPELAKAQLDAGRLVAPFGLRVELPYAYYLASTMEALARKPVRAFVSWLTAQAVAR